MNVKVSPSQYHDGSYTDGSTLQHLVQAPPLQSLEIRLNLFLNYKQTPFKFYVEEEQRDVREEKCVNKY